MSTAPNLAAGAPLPPTTTPPSSCLGVTAHVDLVMGLEVIHAVRRLADFTAHHDLPAACLWKITMLVTLGGQNLRENPRQSSDPSSSQAGVNICAQEVSC